MKKNKRNLKKKESNFGKKKTKRRKLGKNDKIQEKKKEKCTVDYCCNPQYFVCGEQ